MNFHGEIRAAPLNKNILASRFIKVVIYKICYVKLELLSIRIMSKTDMLQRVTLKAQ